MNIWFFEEFPNKKSLEKAKLIHFPSTVFIAARSLKEFRKLGKKLKSINPSIEVAYWPTLKESYWISAFSNSYELQDLYKELAQISPRINVLIDLELPILKPSLFLKNILSIGKNRKIIKRILELKNLKIFTAEYPQFSFSGRIMKILGIYGSGTNKIPLAYSSMASRLLRKHLRKIRSEFIGLGTIEKGILGNEPILSPGELNTDLESFNKLKTKTAVIFRLGGLNKEYVKVINKYL